MIMSVYAGIVASVSAQENRDSKEPEKWMLSGGNSSGWNDTDGNHISCHEGGVTRFGDTFYWYGTSYKGNPGGKWGKGGHTLQNGFTVYSSKDLVHWKSYGACIDFNLPENTIRGTAHRPNVIFNDATKNYVMWFFDIVKYPDVMMTVATSKSPTGPFTIVGLRETGEPHGYAQDCGLFKDDDGKAYLVYDDGFRNLRVDLLSDDYLSSTKQSVIALKPRHEGAAIGKIKGKYIVAGSGITGWGASETDYAVADSPLGPYTEMKRMSEKLTWGSQVSNFFYIKETDSLVAVCDRLSMLKDTHDLDKCGYLWVPVSIDVETKEAKMNYDQQSIPAIPGTQSPGGAR